MYLEYKLEHLSYHVLTGVITLLNCLPAGTWNVPKRFLNKNKKLIYFLSHKANFEAWAVFGVSAFWLVCLY